MTIEFANAFRKDLRKIKKSHCYSKLKELVTLIIDNPFKTPHPYEKLENMRKNIYSRRINDQHQLMYCIEEDTIICIQCWGHYSD